MMLHNDCPPQLAMQLATHGFVVLPGPSVSGGIERLQSAYDACVASADPADVRIASSIRVTDFVNRSQEFDCIYIHPPLLAACSSVIGGSFKLSSTCARTLSPGAPAQALHVDVKRGDPDWPMLGYIWMIDAFGLENGATRFIPGSHRHPHALDESEIGDCNDVTLACGPAGSLIVFDASVRHGHGANRSLSPRRSVQGHFVARDARSAIDYRSRMKAETFDRLGAVAKYLLGLE